jgi:mono/diheme cytochrome c family protein
MEDIGRRKGRCRPAARWDKLRRLARSGVLAILATVALSCEANITLPEPAPEVNLPADSTYFAERIQPIFAEHCVRCHGGVRELGGLNLLSKSGARHVLATTAGKPETSRLYQSLVDADEAKRMPLGAPALAASELATISEWLRRGAPWSLHWAYESVATPAQDDARTASASIDLCVSRELKKQGLEPSPPAAPATLVRRLSLDLTGLPPAPEDVDAARAAGTAFSIESYVDKLLASSAYGEHWGRHWLDQARYSDSDGYEKDLPRYGAYHYRDWVVSAMNADLPFHEFTVAQLAGDLMPNATPASTLPTAFHTQTLFNREGGVDAEEDRVKRTFDRAETVASTWLGIHLECARCHNHPYDPFSQLDYYHFYAFFNETEERELSITGGTSPADISSVLGARARETYVLTRGDFLRPDTSQGRLVADTPAILPPLGAEASPPSRLDLARWITSPQNPLTARVRANTIWSHLFGQGLVTTLSDFGTRGSLPSHPELLEALAVRFASLKMSQKKLIREIVLSNTYLQDSRFAEQSARQDPDNRLLSRQARFRLDAESVRDATLFASGMLNMSSSGPGIFPPLPEGLEQLVQGPYSSFVWQESSIEDRNRRSLYVFHKRSLPYPSLRVFDWPAADRSQNGRARSLSPLQVLTTLHDPTYLEAARNLAQGAAPLGSEQAQIEFLFVRILSRDPTLTELALLDDLLTAQGGREPADSRLSTEQLTDVARALFTSDEFLTRE